MLCLSNLCNHLTRRRGSWSPDCLVICYVYPIFVITSLGGKTTGTSSFSDMLCLPNLCNHLIRRRGCCSLGRLVICSGCGCSCLFFFFFFFFCFALPLGAICHCDTSELYYFKRIDSIYDVIYISIMCDGLTC